MSICRFGVRTVVSVCILLLTCQLSCREAPSVGEPTIQSEPSPQPRPPDLSRCERIRIWLAPSTVDFVCITPRERTLLSPEEIRYLESVAPFIVDSPEVIQTFAKDIGSSTYVGPIPGVSGIQYQIYFTCYEMNGRAIYLTTIGNIPDVGNIVEAGGHRFKNNGIHFRTLVPQVAPFMLRVRCARNLSELHGGLRYYLDEEKSYPPAIEWYDAMVHRYQAKGYTTNVARLERAVSCPAASHGEYNYAMNPDCEPNSPPDTVLLFEARPGRNQHGGPELFTFDNHDPKGGCVLLKDGTAKFIRTKEELEQLRW